MEEKKNKKKKDEEDIVEKGEVKKIKSVEIEYLQEGEETFLSHGFSNIKITKGKEVSNVKLPIKSSGVTELIEEFKAQEPVPPSQEVFVKKDSDLGKQMKLSENRPVRMPNLNDPKYVKEFNQYESKLGIAIVQKGLDIPIKDKDGKVVEDNNKKIEILRSMGLSGPQFTQLVTDIRQLTEYSEQEMIDFFGES